MPVDSDVSILSKFRQLSTDRAIPLQASLELTNRCNERCTHCYIPSFKDDPKRVIDLADWFKVLDELRSGGAFYLILMGGEAMLSPHFWPVAERAANLNFHVSIISNGLKIKTLEVAQKLKTTGVKLVTLSLYSLDPAIHDKMTSVPGSHKRTMQAIEFCQQAGLEVNINSLLTQDNHKSIFDLYEWASENQVEMKVDPHVTPKLDGNLDPTRLRLSKMQLKEFFEERARRWPRSFPTPSASTQSDHICNVARGKCAVTAYGELLGCIEVREPLGSLVTDSFAKLWWGDIAEKWRGLTHKDLSLKDSELGFCEHCPGMAYNECGDHKKVTEYSSVISGVKKDIFEAREK